ncbi:CDKN2A-interacting protein [Narcine bancroftii]|uniref:CDKN2A-interacting protein n=1 Tax=Narcine bancroftii TaxID=1343680 RepID=UPI0038317600
MAVDEVSEFLQQNQRLADWLQTLKGESEAENHWKARRAFIVRNMREEQKASGAEPGIDTDRLLALSMVWANHVFLGCRYSKKVMDKVLEMGEGINVADPPVHTTRDELVANKKKRELPKSNEKIEEEPCAKKKPVKEDKCIEFPSLTESTGNGSKNVDPNKIPGLDGFPDTEPPSPLPETKVEAPVSSVPPTSTNDKKVQQLDKEVHQVDKEVQQVDKEVQQVDKEVQQVDKEVQQVDKEVQQVDKEVQQVDKEVQQVDKEVQQVAKESEVKKLATPMQAPVTHQQTGPPRSEPPVQTKSSSSNSAEVKPAIQPDITDQPVSVTSSQKAVQPSVSQSSKPPITVVIITPQAIKEKQAYYNKLYKAIAWKLVPAGGFSNELDHLTILSNCIQSTKGMLESVCVPLKDISELHLPQNCAREGIVCELRCKSVYLATGYGKCKVSAKEMAAKEAVKLFLKLRVTVKMCKRKYKGSEIEDLVLLSEDTHRLNLAPALINPSESFGR